MPALRESGVAQIRLQVDTHRKSAGIQVVSSRLRITAALRAAQ
jgi:hypothetical protein